MAQSSRNLTKIQIRKELVSLISKYKDMSLVKNSQLLADIDYLDKIDDRSYVLDFLLKEMLSEKGTNSNICALFIMELFDKDILETKGLELLSSDKVSDDKKFFLISVLKQKGIHIDYQDISNYIDNPDDIAKEGVRKFLSDLIVDPEVQIDLLDFYTNIPEFEKIPLLNSILNENNEDITALALSLITQTAINKDDFQEGVFDLLLEKLLSLKNAYALEGLKYISDNFELTKKQRLLVINAIKDIEYNHNDKDDFKITKDSVFNKAYISFIDGQSNFSLIFSRIDKQRNFKVFLATCNLNIGIISCMGFSKINNINFSAILQRLFSDSMPVEIPPQILKGILNYFLEKNKKTKTEIPYEFVVWKRLMSDIKDIDFDLVEFLKTNLVSTALDETKVKKLSTSKLLATWYYAKNENKKIDTLLDEIETNRFKDFVSLETHVEKYIENNFMTDDEFLSNLSNRLMMLAYIAKSANLMKSSMSAYSLCEKNDYTKIIVSSIIEKSIYYYFITQCVVKSNENNIFNKKNNSNYSIDEMTNLISGFELKWNQKKE